MNKTVTSSIRKNGMALMLLICLALIPVFGQSSFDVGVTSNVFSPNDLTIEVGDKVVWTNSQGNHNVNGTQTTFTENPESFGNQVGSGWVYEYVFTVPGTYNYQCDPHAALGMTGMITVQEGEETPAIQFADISLQVFPNPAGNVIRIISEEPVVSVSLISVTGSRVFTLTGQEATGAISLEGIASGIYVAKIKTADMKTSFTRLVKQ